MSARVPLIKSATGVHELYDVNVERLSIVDKGANRKRWFLRKRGGDEGKIEFDLAEGRAPIAKADWSTVYCVVAEPGSLEDPGIAEGTDQSVPDRWGSADEIEKACWRFAENGSATNHMHATLAPFGTVVENAIAQVDFSVAGPDGESHTIRKGSWYIGLKPTDEGRTAIENGELTGVSIEGSGIRRKVAKAEVPTKPGTANVTAGDRAKLGPLLRHYAAMVHPFTSCKRDQMKHGLSADHANRRCAVLKDLIRGTTKWRVSKGATPGAAPWSADAAAALDRIAKAIDDGADVDEIAKALGGEQTANGGSLDGMREFFRKLGRSVGIPDDEIDAALEGDEIAKGTPTFAQRMAVRDIDDELPQAIDVFRSTVWGAVYSGRETDAEVDVRAIVEQSCDEFKAWVLDLVETSEIAKLAESIPEDLQKAFDQSGVSATVDREMGLNAEEQKQLTELKSAVEELPAEIAKAIKGDGEKPGNGEGSGGESGEGEESESTEDRLTKIAESVETLTKRVEALGAGGSTVPNDPEAVAKSGGNGGSHMGIL